MIAPPDGIGGVVQCDRISDHPTALTPDEEPPMFQPIPLANVSAPA